VSVVSLSTRDRDGSAGGAKMDPTRTYRPPAPTPGRSLVVAEIRVIVAAKNEADASKTRFNSYSGIPAIADMALDVGRTA
jgi:hypothetical protein